MDQTCIRDKKNIHIFFFNKKCNYAHESDGNIPKSIAKSIWRNNRQIFSSPDHS